MPSVSASRVVTPEGVVTDAEVAIEGEVIAEVRPARGRADHDVLVPGFVDLQVNGHRSIDVSRARGPDWDLLDDILLDQGVTSWCPTIPSTPLSGYPERLASIDEAARRPGPRPTIAGAHLEGPFLSPEHAGAHPVDHLTAVDIGWLDELPGIVKVVTLAPELPHALDAVRALDSRGLVIGLGHTGADHETAREATDAGARLVTHVFNAMRPLHHRDPGVVGTALSDDRLTVALIGDLVHVHPVVVGLTVRVKGPGSTALVTDSVAWDSDAARDTGLRIDAGAVRLPDGTIAGSALTMDAAFRNAVDVVGIPLAHAAALTATTPATLVGLDDRGRIAPGARADLVALDGDLGLRAVWLGGETVR